MASPKLQAALLVSCSCLLLSLIAVVSASSASAPAPMVKRLPPAPMVKPPAPTPMVKPPAPAPMMKPPVKPKVPKDCCYSRRNIRICINPAKPVGQCQTICNITVCCTGPGVPGVLPAPAMAPAPAVPAPAYGGYYPVVPSPDKCCFCYRGIRFCLSRQPPTSKFPFCARNVCKKYNICFPKERC